jgi:alpha-ketoglutarate-dependent taurine dioxygenase
LARARITQMPTGLQDQKAIKQELAARGWCWISSEPAADLASLLVSLGPVLAERRTGSEHQDLRPFTRDTAPPGSMSAITGTRAQPMHTDAAYYPRPPRYVAFLCLEAGEAPCPTLVWPLDIARLKRDRPKILMTPNWVAHGGGFARFYCSVMESQFEAIRIRFDPLCMHLASGLGTKEAEETLRGYSTCIQLDWEHGHALIIDNWRCLHARGEGAGRAPSRRLRPAGVSE